MIYAIVYNIHILDCLTSLSLYFIGLAIVVILNHLRRGCIENDDYTLMLESKSGYTNVKSSHLTSYDNYEGQSNVSFYNKWIR